MQPPFLFFSPPNAVNRCSFHGNTHELHGYCSSEHIFWLAEGGMESRPCVCGWNAAGGVSLISVLITWVLSQTHTHTHSRRLPFTRRHTDWLTCSLTHWVNRHVSHFKSSIFITTRSARTSNFHFSGERRLLGLCKHLAPVQMPPTNAASARPHKQPGRSERSGCSQDALVLFADAPHCVWGAAYIQLSGITGGSITHAVVCFHSEFRQ